MPKLTEVTILSKIKIGTSGKILKSVCVFFFFLFGVIPKEQTIQLFTAIAHHITSLNACANNLLSVKILNIESLKHKSESVKTTNKIMIIEKDWPLHTSTDTYMS